MPANILVVTSDPNNPDVLREYTQGGALVQNIATIPPSGGITEHPRDLVLDASNRIHVYNGTFSPWLSTRSGGSWFNQTIPGWSTVANVTFGGIAMLGNYLFLTDMYTGGDGSWDERGIIRVNMGTGAWVRFGQGQLSITVGAGFQDLTIGLDGKLYALDGTGMPSTTVQVYDPMTLGYLRTVNLAQGDDHRGIAVDAAGNIFAATWNGSVNKFDSNGQLLNSVPAGAGVYDLTISNDGQQLVMGAGGQVVLMSTALTNVSTFSVPTFWGCFVAFKEPPPPRANIDPVAVAGPDQSTIENGAALQFDGSASSDADGDPLTYFWNFGDGTTATGPTPSHVFRDDGTYLVRLTVNDGFGGTDSDTLVVTVANVAPAAAVSGPATGVIRVPATFTLRATDRSPVDQAAGFVYRINWGDGTAQTVSGLSGRTISHAYALVGTFTVQITATDKDGARSTVAGTRITISGPVKLRGADLLVDGTRVGDRITITPTDRRGTVRVQINSRIYGPYRPTRQIVVSGNAGNDVVRLATALLNGSRFAVPWPVVFFGNAGNDVFDGRSSRHPNVLVGGPGADRLVGGSGRDILMGGVGSDALLGNASDDILVGGTTRYDASLAALMALRAEWRRTDLGFTARVAHLRGQQSGGRNGGVFLNPSTAQSDSVPDDFFGSLGQDWFLGNSTDRQYDSALFTFV